MPVPAILVLNAGSTSIRFGLLRAEPALARLAKGRIEDVGGNAPRLSFAAGAEGAPRTVAIAGADHDAAVGALLHALRQDAAIVGVGHRIVHGLAHVEPERLTPALAGELHALAAADPEHLPVELRLVEAARRRLPDVAHVACFDTHFHRTLPRVATLLPIPRRFEAQGVRRYGFHGLSYASLMEQLEARGAAGGRVVLAHLGGGASLAAVRDGRCVDTTMGFTPAGGLMMSTRSGDLDPGLASYLERTAGVTGAQWRRMVNHESGLLGVSETSGDMRALLAAEAADARAAEAIALFCHQARKAIGAFAAVLGGLDTLVFAGGIGEAQPAIRSRICEGLGFLGITLDEARNAGSEALVSRGAVGVHVLRTDEERVIARQVLELLESGHGA